MTLNPFSPLQITLQAGIIMTKTEACLEEGRGKGGDRGEECPVCGGGEELKEYGGRLRGRGGRMSKVVCRISGEEVIGGGVVWVTPGGWGYGGKGVEKSVGGRGDGKMECVMTGQVFRLDQLRRAYIL